MGRYSEVRREDSTKRKAVSSWKRFSHSNVNKPKCFVPNKSVSCLNFSISLICQSTRSKFMVHWLTSSLTTDTFLKKKHVDFTALYQGSVHFPVIHHQNSRFASFLCLSFTVIQLWNRISYFIVAFPLNTESSLHL
jgi:hypothetical protein